MPQAVGAGSLRSAGGDQPASLHGGLVARTRKGAAKFLTLNESSGLRTVGIYHGEFDPGSERTLAACLKHASRAARASNGP